MKKLTCAALLLAAPFAWAAPQTLTLSVPTMSCATCPVAIKVALLKVPGVSTVRSELAKRQTTVVYEGTKTNVATISGATAAAGFPSSPLGASK